MADLSKLEGNYREAQSAYAGDRSGKNRRAYHKARQAFSDARVKQRQAEEADPDHPRGQGLASVKEG